MCHQEKVVRKSTFKDRRIINNNIDKRKKKRRYIRKQRVMSFFLNIIETNLGIRSNNKNSITECTKIYHNVKCVRQKFKIFIKLFMNFSKMTKCLDKPKSIL